MSVDGRGIAVVTDMGLWRAKKEATCMSMVGFSTSSEICSPDRNGPSRFRCCVEGTLGRLSRVSLRLVTGSRRVLDRFGTSAAGVCASAEGSAGALMARCSFLGRLSDFDYEGLR